MLLLLCSLSKWYCNKINIVKVLTYEVVMQCLRATVVEHWMLIIDTENAEVLTSCRFARLMLI